jgi:Tfp pilus assembly major pilin PilA
VESVTVADEKITAKFKPDGVNENIKGKSLLLTATDAGGSVTFECTTDIDSSYAPTGCTHDDSVGGPVAWSSLTSDEQAATTACWDQSVADSGDGNGWVEGSNTYTGSQADVRGIAEDVNWPLTWGKDTGAVGCM